MEGMEVEGVGTGLASKAIPAGPFFASSAAGSSGRDEETPKRAGIQSPAFPSGSSGGVSDSSSMRAQKQSPVGVVLRVVQSSLHAEERALHLPQVVPGVPPHTPLQPAALPRVPDEVAGVKPRHDQLPLEGPAVDRCQVFGVYPPPSRLSDAAGFEG